MSAFAGGGTNWSLAQGLGSGKSDAFQAGVYGVTKSGPAYLAAAFAFTNHWVSTDRLAFGDHLTANFNARSFGGRLEGGYRFGIPYGGITPYAAIQAQNFHSPGYTETALIPSGFALAFGSRDATDTRSELGARFDRVVALHPNNAVLALRDSRYTPSPSFGLLSGSPTQKPIRRIRSGCCCARAVSGHAAAPPRSVMNSRRFIRSPRRRSTAALAAR
jgi:hypothetical protein